MQTTYNITKIENQPTRTGNPCCYIEYENETGKKGMCIVYLNHKYIDGKFVPRTKSNGEPWDYEKFDFGTPVKSTAGSKNGFEKYIIEEFKRRFQKQKKEESW
ncbi:hypothetical protein GF361_02185 [Candidatus Woesearchaeota archaeon]|nr:hypothetical protein [Candidatus Woesearchaeota archaeon]